MEEFQNIFSRPLFIIIFRPKILFFVTYSILTGQTKVEFVKYWVLRAQSSKELQLKRNPIASEQTITCQLLPIIEKNITKKNDPYVGGSIYENSIK